MSNRFGQLLETLNQSELAMTSYELADMCWLLLNAPQIEELSKSKSSLPTESKQSQSLKLEKQEAKSKKSDKQSPPPQNNFKPPERTEKSEDAGLYPRQPQSHTTEDTLTFPVDNPTDLGSSLALAKALKGLLRKVPALNQPEVLDEISTVDNYAATNKAVLTPFFQPALEPWLDIALVVDGNFSLDIWHQTIDDLILFLRNYGIFRDVLIWKLVCEQEKLLLYKGLKIANARIANPKELLSPSGRRIIIILSDCVADYWRNGKPSWEIILFILKEISDQ